VILKEEILVPQGGGFYRPFLFATVFCGTRGAPRNTALKRTAMFTAQITIRQEEKEAKTALLAVTAAFKTKKYRVEVYENGTSLFTFYAIDEEEAKAEVKNMMARLKRRYT